MSIITMKDGGIPVVDLKGLPSDDAQTMAEITKDIDKGLKSHSCLQLVGHGVPKHVTARLFRKSKAFFELPEERKFIYEKGNRKGHDIVGYSRSAKESFRERFDFKLRWRDEGVFPEEDMPGITAALVEYQEALSSVARFLLARFANALGLDNEEHFIQCHRAAVFGDPTVSSKSHISSIFYEEIPEAKSHGVDFLMEKHTDLSSITFLSSSAPGLQVQLLGGNWMDVVQVPGSIFLHIGDQLEFLTGGKYAATIHRVKHLEGDSTGRQSLAYFVHPDTKVLITPGKTMTGQDPNATMTAGAYFERMMILKNAYTIETQ